MLTSFCKRFKVGFLKSVTIGHCREHNERKCRWFTAVSLCKNNGRTFTEARMVVLTVSFVSAPEDIAANINHTTFHYVLCGAFSDSLYITVVL